MAQCKLCLNDKKLCNSHIIPEYYYKPLYEKKPKRFYLVTDSENDRIQFPQKGIRERLFCRDCEDIFMNYEQCAETVYDTIKSRYLYPKKEFIQFKSVEYARFKLFQLSILFRASVSTLYFFQEIDIGYNNEETLRKRLLNQYPGEYYEYACTMTLLLENVGISNNFIMYPDTRTHKNGKTVLRFVFGGIIWIYYPSIFAPPKKNLKFYSLKKERLKLWTMHRKNTEFIQDFLEHVEEMGRFDEIKEIREKTKQ